MKTDHYNLNNKYREIMAERQEKQNICGFNISTE